jgi:hypothetical protein
MKIEYSEHRIEDVLGFYVKGFNLIPGRLIARYEANCDPRTGMVVFKLFISDRETNTPETPPQT